MIRVFGQITDASGKGVAGAMIELRALKSSTEVLYGSVFTYKCDASGHYEFPLAIGAYDAYAQNDICGDMDYLGTAVVTADTNDGDLHHILVDGGINITPPMLDAAMEFALRAEKAATSAKSDRIRTGKDVIVTGKNKQVAEIKAQESAILADEAKAARDSIVQDANEVRHNTQQVADNAASVASNTTLVQRNAEQVAQNTQTVSTKAQQVSENTQSVAANTQAVSLMRDEVVAKTSMAQAAADTATQKAASAAEHDASSAVNAKIAQDAASAVQGVLIDGGECDLSSGAYPPPQTVAGKNYSTVWYVKTGGTVSSVTYDAGDVLRYTTAKGGYYFRVDAVDTTTAQISQHAAKAGAHTISGVLGLTEALADKADAAAVAEGFRQHSLTPDPHTQYVKKADANPFPQYSDFRTGESRMFETRAQLAKRAAEYHPMDGQLVPRATDQGLLAAIIAGEVPSCPDADWLADPYKRNNYTLGDGSTNIRLPDRNGKYPGTVGSVFARGDGDNAPAPGMIHGDAIRNITGSFAQATKSGSWLQNVSIGGAFRPAGTNLGSGSRPADGGNSGSDTGYGVVFDASLVVPTATQGRPTSISRVWSVKR
ncbi:prophage tail fiber N-terminal domain-containing protein [Plesiomonas shigelloides]|uniref:Prophage tail fiber N-terminal domain-containing protein n=1 Tax=Plesiomonas shigelloides TaxID=703 RepID=A0A8I1W997_PLESH|nr:prophage tail fiber N-terminal domain-containing protein [Plesiomonas shigelloides]MBO1109575.1 prophage tail fiber N-terminal domain-containing protein [Plesiomonas shigelloides]